MVKRDGFGLNFLHHKALTSKNLEELGEFKAVSTKKKPYGKAMIYPIYCAALNPNPEILKAMYEVIDNKLIADEYFGNVLHYAALCEGDGPMKYLLEQGLPIDMMNQLKETPLLLAAKYGRHAVCEALLEKGASWKKMKDKKGYGPMHYAAIYGHKEVIKSLVKYDVDINQNGSGSMSPLHLASA